MTVKQRVSVWLFVVGAVIVLTAVVVITQALQPFNRCVVVQEGHAVWGTGVMVLDEVTVQMPTNRGGWLDVRRLRDIYEGTNPETQFVVCMRAEGE